MNSTLIVGRGVSHGKSAAIKLLRLTRRFADADGRQEAKDELRADAWALWRERHEARRLAAVACD
jgi:hypothetical protein